MFAPQRLPSDSIQRLSNATNNEFVRLSQFLAGAQDGVSVRVLYAPPSKYSEGTIVYADGTTWNPGYGRGFYYRAASTWEPLAGTGAVAPGSVTTASLAANLALVEVVTALPSAGNFNGRTVYLTTDGQLYRYYSSAWTAAVPAVNVTGQLTNSQIADLSAAKLTGQITETQITDSAISTAKLAAGSVSTDRLAATAVTADKIASNAVTAVKISAGAVEADKIATNAVTAAKIAANAVTAGKIDAGAVTADKISVTSLGAITTTTGTLIVNTTGYVRGGQTDYATGTGFFLGYSGSAYKFSVGDSTNFLKWSGTALEIGGKGTFYSAYNTSNYASLGTDSDGSVIRVYKTQATILPPFYIYDTAAYSAVQSAWIRSDNGPAMRVDSGDVALYVISTSGGNTISKPLVDIIGSRQESQFRVQAKQTTGLSNQHAARFYAFNTSNSVVASGIAATQSGYAYYGETGTIAPFTGSHDGLLLKAASVAPGDILVDDGIVIKKDVSNTLFKVARSSQPNQAAIGVYVSSEALSAAHPPASFITGISQDPVYDDEGQVTSYAPKYEVDPSFTAAQADYDIAIVNALGEGQINVCGEGGDIQPGDLIATSSMAGKGMKQADDVVRGYTVAKAREAAVFSSPSEVKQIACIYVCG